MVTPGTQDLNDLAYFAWVVEAQGFAAAGRAHGVPKSRLSRRIRALEERLGVRLLQRSTRRFSVTTAGKEFYRHCKAMLLEAEAAQETIERRRSEPRGVVRLTCPVALLHYAVGDILAAFLLACPQVELHVEATNRRPDVIGEGLDLALRVRFPPLADSELVMKKLGDSPQCLVASPMLLRNFTTLHAPDDLAQLPSLGTRLNDAEQVWHLEGPWGEQRSIGHTPRLITDDFDLLRRAALAGVGIAQLPTLAVHEQLNAGTLVRVLPDWKPPCGVVHAVFPSNRGLLPAVRSLIDFLAGHYTQFDAR